MMKTKTKMLLTAMALVAGLNAASNAGAAVIVSITDTAAGAVASTSGTLDLTGLTYAGQFSLSRGVSPSSGYVGTGATAYGGVTAYTGLTGTTTFGSGAYTEGTSGTGVEFGLNGSFSGMPYVFVQQGYVSGSSLAGTTTFVGQTLASLGLTTGSYVFRSAADSVTFNIGSVAAVPEIGTWAMMILGMGAIGFSMRRRKVTTRVSYAA